MKTTYLIILFLGITFLGCSDNFNDAIVSTSIQTENPTTPIIANQMAALDFDGSNQAISPFIIASKSINGVTGGVLLVDTSYVNYQGRLVYVYARIFVQELTFQGTTEFIIKLHPEEATIELFPHMVFDIPVRISAWFTGIDLKEMGYNTNGHVDFAYFDDVGNTEIITAQQTHVNLQQMTIKVLNAQLNHFSRYGWVRGQQ